MEKNRLLALRALGSYFSLFQTKYPLAEKVSFSTMLESLQRNFSLNYEQYSQELDEADVESEEWISRCRRRQYCLSALTFFLGCEQAETENSIAVIDSIIHLILQDTKSKTIFLQAQALNLLAAFKFTPKNRDRIFQFYPAIIELDPDQFIEGTSSLEVPVHPFLAAALSKFWSVWYPKTPDKILMALPEDTMHKHLFGYAQRRLAELAEYEHPDEGEEEEEEETSSEDSEYEEEDKASLSVDARVPDKFSEAGAIEELEETESTKKEKVHDKELKRSKSKKGEEVEEESKAGEEKLGVKDKKDRKAAAAKKKKKAAIKAIAAVSEQYKEKAGEKQLHSGKGVSFSQDLSVDDEDEHRRYSNLKFTTRLIC